MKINMSLNGIVPIHNISQLDTVQTRECVRRSRIAPDIFTPRSKIVDFGLFNVASTPK